MITRSPHRPTESFNQLNAINGRPRAVSTTQMEKVFHEIEYCPIKLTFKFTLYPASTGTLTRRFASKTGKRITQKLQFLTEIFTQMRLIAPGKA